MMKTKLLGLLLFVPLALRAQDDSTITLDLLRAPASPAFNVLGISPSVIERPTDLSAFRLSIQNATNNFTQLPNSYAIEVSPAALAQLRNQTLDKFNSTRFSDVFTQSLSLSIGFTHDDPEDQAAADSADFTKLGFGVKFSLIRPRWTAQTEKLFTDLQKAQADFLNNVIAMDTGAQAAAIRQQMQAVQNNRQLPASVRADSLAKLAQQLGNLNQAYVDAVNQQLQDSVHFMALKAAARNFKVERKGPFLDFAAGIAVDFPSDRFEYSLTSRAGAWLTGGYEGGNNGFTALGIVRYLYQPSQFFIADNNVLDTAGVSTLDAGARILLTTFGGRFTLGAEGIYRSVLNSNTVDPTWRFTFNTEYDISANRKVTLSIGRNFEGVYSEGGNLIAAINFIAGFGSNKKIGGSQN